MRWRPPRYGAASSLTIVSRDVSWTARLLAGGPGAEETTFGPLEAIQLRDFAKDRHHSVDDTPFGGGAGSIRCCGPT